MSLNPLNELKRKLDNQDVPLQKRLCLAKNVIQSHHFPSAPKERVVADWLQALTKKNKLSGDDFRSVMGWLNVTDNLTNELKSKSIQIVSQYLKRNPLQNEDVQSILSFLENAKLSIQLSIHIEECLYISVTLLQFLKSEDKLSNLQLSQRVFKNIIKFYRDSKKKLEFITKLIDEENLETIFSYLDVDRSTVLNVCQTVLFTVNKKQFFASYLLTLVRKDNIDDLIAGKGNNIQSVLKIMDTFFAFPKGRSCIENTFLYDFIDVFVTCYCSESQLIFAFYIMIANCLDMEQDYLTPATNMNTISIHDNSKNFKRNLFLKMLDVILSNEVDVNVKLSDTLGVKIPKVETKKTFLMFLEALLKGQLKMEGKPDKTTFEIIKTALKLDPSLIEPKMNEILPYLLSAKKSASVMESYTQMVNSVLETVFKLSRGTIFLNEILPFLKICLEASNTEQRDLKEKLEETIDSGKDCKKIKNKVITASDILPEESLELYGKLTSELMFRQSKDVLLSLQKDFEELVLRNLSVENVSPSIIILTELMSAILSSFFKHCKMADHTVPVPIAEEFWLTFKDFERKFLKKFGKYILNLDCDSQLVLPLLKLCLSISHLKVLNIKYSNIKLDIPYENSSSEVFDLSFLLPCLSNEQWTELASKITDEGAALVLNEILLVKTLAIQAATLRNSENDNEESISQTKSYIIKQLSATQMLQPDNYITQILFNNLEKNQRKQVAKSILKHCLTINPNENNHFIENDEISTNKLLIEALVLETVKNLLKCFENAEPLIKAINKSEFDFLYFAKERDMKELFGQLRYSESNKDNRQICVNVLRALKIYHLGDTYRLLAIFMLLATKKSAQKRLRETIDCTLESIFHSNVLPPDLFKIFPVKFIFSFKDRVLINLLTLEIETSNTSLVIKCLIESAVKRVKMEKDIVINIVELLLTQLSKVNTTGLEFFSDPVFQIICIILPLIVKQKKVITLSAPRTILAELQEKLQASLLKCFKKINFKEINSIIVDGEGNTDLAVSKSTMAALNAYSITLSKYCESNDVEDIKNLDVLWPGLEFFIQNAMQSIQNREFISANYENVVSAIEFLNFVLRYLKRLDIHGTFRTNDKLFLQIWSGLKAVLSIVLDEDAKSSYMWGSSILEDAAVTIKFISEWVSVEGFVTHFVSDLNTLAPLKASSKALEDATQSHSLLISHRVAKYLWVQILKANVVGPKCVALSKLMYQNSRNLKSYIHDNYEIEDTSVVIKSKKKKLSVEFYNDNVDNMEIKVVKVDDTICEMIQIYMETLSEAILAAKRMNLDYKFLDSIFEVQHSVHFIMGRNSISTRCEISWQSFCKLFQSCVAVLNSLLVSREELLEDRWPCYMQCYRTLILCLCGRSSSQAQQKQQIADTLGDMAHSIEKLTQAICKRKSHVSHIAAYSVGDICSSLEQSVPPRNVRQHLENSTALLIQAGDTSHAMAFLRRSLAGSPGQMTMTNMYTMYKRYHKYVGNA